MDGLPVSRNPNYVPILTPLGGQALPQLTPAPIDVGNVDPANYAQASTPIPLQNQQPQMPMQMTIEAPRNTSESTQKQYSPAAEKEYIAAKNAQKDAIDAQMKFEQARAEEVAKLQAATMGEMQASYDRQAQSLQDKQAKYEQGVAAYDQAVGKYSSAKLSDPRENESVFSRIGAAIAVGLGAYASAKTGTPNYALNIVNDTIDRSIANQKFMIEKLGVEAASKKSDLARLGQELGNFDLAEKALRQTMLEKTKAQIDIASAKSASEGIKLRGDALKAGLDEEIAKVKLDGNTITKRLVESGPTTTMSTVGGAKMQGLDTPLGRASTDTGATKLRDAYANYKKGIGSLDNFDKFIAKIDVKNYTPGKQAGEFDNAKDEVINVIRVLNELGTLQQGEYDRLAKEVAGIKSPSTLQGRAAGLRSRLERDVKATAAAWAVGGEPQNKTQQQKNNLGFQGN